MAQVENIVFFESCGGEGQYILQGSEQGPQEVLLTPELYSTLFQDDSQTATNGDSMGPTTEESQSSVTHIEIIKPSFRRVSGANRVVPLLTNTLRKYSATSSGIGDAYRNLLTGVHSDNRYCKLCQQECLSPADLLQHVTTVHHSVDMDIVPEQCFVCRKVYVFKDKLLYHLSKVHGIQSPDLICKTCFMEFNTTMEQKAHERKHEGVYSCHLCVKKFSSEYLRQKHVNDHLFHSRQNECNKCGKRFKNHSILKMHEKRHENRKCFVCAAESNDEISTLHHLKNHTPGDIQKFLTHVMECDENEVKLEEMYNAYLKFSSKRGKPFSHQEEDRSIINCVTNMVNTVLQVNNLEAAEEKKGVQCRICGFCVGTAKELVDHRKEFHLRNRTCLFCGKRNGTVSQAWRHMKIHLTESKKSQHLVDNDRKELSKPQSVNREMSDSALRKQNNGKTSAQLHSCSVCSRKFQCSESRDKHMQQHSKEMHDLTCDNCGLLFENSELLLDHLCEPKAVNEQSTQESVKGTETSKPVFKCNLCAVKCPTKSGLQMHERCHTGERPYTCGQCRKKFKRLQAVKKHIQIVHSPSLKYHICSDCPKEFSTFGNLVRHYMRVHCQIYRFICGLCGYRCGQNQDLRRHFKAVHRLDMPNIHGMNRKSLCEVYVIPGIENFPPTDPHAVRINRIVGEERSKFDGMTRMLQNINRQQEKSALKTIQFVEENAEDSTKKTVLAVPPQTTDWDVTDGDQDSINNVIGETDLDLPSTTNDTSKSNEIEIYTCSCCSQVFLEKHHYAKHISTHDTKYMCELCNASFANDIALRWHLRVQHKLWSCKVCSQNFSDKISFTKHMQEVEGVDVLDSAQANRQPILERSAAKPAASAGSQATASSFSNIPTVIANKIPAALNVGGILIQNIIVQGSPVLQAVPLPFPSQCVLPANQVYTPYVTLDSSTMTSVKQEGSSFVTIDDISNLPVGEIAADPPQASPDCLPVGQENMVENVPSAVDIPSVNTPAVNGNENEISDSPKEVFDQLNAQDDSYNSNTRGHEGQVECEECAEHFPNATALSHHMKTHTKRTPYTCSDCGKHFTEKHNLKAHRMVHTGERPYECEDCGKKLRYKTCVLDHKLMHTGVKPFACDQCGRKFIRQRELNRHKNVHTGEKKYLCPVCGKAFGRLDQLKCAHIPTHDPDKSHYIHTCNVCDKSFGTRTRLKQHEVLHSGLKTFQCDICKKSFAREVYLKTHLESHKKRDTYIQCSKCPRKFRSQHTLQVHDTSFHRRIKKSKRKNPLKSENILTGNEDQTLPTEMETADALGIDIEITDSVDLDALEAENCNAVIYLHMEPEDIKFAFATDV